MSDNQNNASGKDIKDAQNAQEYPSGENTTAVLNVENPKPAAASSLKGKIIVAAALLAGVWSVFFAVFTKNIPNVASLKNSVSQIARKTDSVVKLKTKSHNKKYKKAKDFALTDLDGKIVKLSSLKGKTVFIDFWASWCPPCKMSIPAVKKLHAKMKNNPNVVVLSINCWEEKKKAVNFVKREGIDYPVLIADGTVEKDYNVSSIPHFFIIDGDRNIINEYGGWHPSLPVKWEEDIQEALASKENFFRGEQPPLSDLNGNTINIDDYIGKTVFLAFWSMSSHPCRQAQPAFNSINNKIAKIANVEFFSVNVDVADNSALKAHISENNLKYPVLRATQRFADSYGVSSVYPSCVIIDKNGETVKTFFGYSEGDEKGWAKALNAIVKAK